LRLVKFALLAIIRTSQSAPLHLCAAINISNASLVNTTVQAQSPWVQAPNVRGTYTLLYSCIITLFLCVWTAYHPNIPSTKPSGSLIAKRLRWVIAGTLAPEIVLFCAWQQYWAGRQLKKELNALARNKKGLCVSALSHCAYYLCHKYDCPTHELR